MYSVLAGCGGKDGEGGTIAGGDVVWVMTSDWIS
jgi:hypothetical protein